MTADGVRVGDALYRHLTILQGATWSQAWRFVSGGVPFVDSSWSVRGQVRRTPASAAVLHEWSSAAGNAVVDDAGNLTLAVAAGVSAVWEWDDAVFDVEVSKGDLVYRLVRGRITVDREVTRA